MKSRAKSQLEIAVANRLERLGIRFVQQFIFDEDGGRKWRFDFALLDNSSPSKVPMIWTGMKHIKVAIECEGGIFSRGRHVRGLGYNEDCIKYNTAVSQDWYLFRITKFNINTLEDLLLKIGVIKENPLNPMPLIKVLTDDGKPVQLADQTTCQYHGAGNLCNKPMFDIQCMYKDDEHRTCKINGNFNTTYDPRKDYETQTGNQPSTGTEETELCQECDHPLDKCGRCTFPNCPTNKVKP